MFDFPILSSSPVLEVRPGLPFRLFFGPLDATGAIQGLKGPPRGALLDWVHGPEGPSGGPKFLIAPLGRPDGAQGGGELGLRNNKMHIYSGQGFQKKENASRASHRHFFSGIALFRLTCDKS